LGEIYSHNKNTGNKSIHKINWDKNFNEIGLIYGIKVSIKNIAINIRACRMKYNPVKIRSFGQDNELQIGMSVILFSKSNHCLEITR
jgi:hypothetical protein